MNILLALVTSMTASVASAQPASTEQPYVVEVAMFETKAESTDEMILSAAKAMKPTLLTWTGFIKRDLVKLGDGKWVDVVYWMDMAAAKHAQENFMSCKVCMDFMAHIKETNSQMMHGTVALTQSR